MLNQGVDHDTGTYMCVLYKFKEEGSLLTEGKVVEFGSIADGV